MSGLAFTAIAVATTLLALLVVLARNLLVAAVCLMALLASTAVAYALLGASLLAGMQILVYVAGTVVVIVFAIMLTQSHEIDEPAPAPLRRAVAACASLGFIAVSIGALSSGQLKLSAPVAPSVRGNTREIGDLLLSAGPEGYVLPLEIVSLLLLAVMIGGIALAGARARQDEPEKAATKEATRTPEKAGAEATETAETAETAEAREPAEVTDAAEKVPEEAAA